MDLKKTKYARIFSDTYLLMERYFPPREDDAFWDGLLGEADEIYLKYQRDDFAKAMVVAVVKELEHVRKTERGNYEKNTAVS